MHGIKQKYNIKCVRRMLCVCVCVFMFICEQTNNVFGHTSVIALTSLLRLVTGFSLNVGFLTCDLLRNVYLNRFKTKKNFFSVKLVYFQNEL
jgi:hypothetical protein